MKVKRETLIIVVLGMLTAIGSFSIDMYLPGFPAIARGLHTDIAHVGLTLTSFFIGISLGQFGYGPALDRFGRIGPVVFGMSVYIVAAIGCAFSPSISYLIAMRFFLAIGACVGMVAASAIIRDLFSGKEVARALSMQITVFGIAPVIAPTIGGLVVSAFGWRYIFAVLAAFGTLVSIAVLRVIRGAKGPDRSVSLRPSKVAGAYLQVFKNRQFLVFAATAMVATGGLFSYISGSPFVFINLFGFTATQYGWIFGVNALLYVAGSQVNRALLKKQDSGSILLMVTTLECVLMVILLGGSLFGFLPSWAFMALVALFMFCHAFVAPNAGALALLPFSRNVGSAAASFASIQMISGALVSGLLAYFYNGTKVPMAAMMAACAGLCLVLSIIGNVTLRRAR